MRYLPSVSFYSKTMQYIANNCGSWFITIIMILKILLFCCCIPNFYQHFAKILHVWIGKTILITSCRLKFVIDQSCHKTCNANRHFNTYENLWKDILEPIFVDDFRWQISWKLGDDLLLSIFFLPCTPCGQLDSIKLCKSFKPIIFA